MCYFLYGSVNKGVNDSDYKNTIKNHNFHFNFGDVSDVNLCVKNCTDDYRITNNHCDCHTAIGHKNTDEHELKELSSLLFNLKDVRGIKYVLLSKNWLKDTNKKQETLHIDDVDVVSLLANAEDNCLYKIELYKKYY